MSVVSNGGSFRLCIVERHIDQLWYQKSLECMHRLLSDSKNRNDLKPRYLLNQNFEFRTVEATRKEKEETYDIYSLKYLIIVLEIVMMRSEVPEVYTELKKHAVELELKMSETKTGLRENSVLKDEIVHLAQSFSDTSSVQIVGLLNRNASRSIREQHKYRCIYPERYATENYAFDPLNLVLAVKALFDRRSNEASNNDSSDAQRHRYWHSLLKDKLQLGANQIASIDNLDKLMRAETAAGEHEQADSFRQGLQQVLDALITFILGATKEGSQGREKRDIIFPEIQVEHETAFLYRKSSELMREIHGAFCELGDQCLLAKAAQPGPISAESQEESSPLKMCLFIELHKSHCADKGRSRCFLIQSGPVCDGRSNCSIDLVMAKRKIVKTSVEL